MDNTVNISTEAITFQDRVETLTSAIDPDLVGSKAYALSKFLEASLYLARTEGFTGKEIENLVVQVFAGYQPTAEVSIGSAYIHLHSVASSLELEVNTVAESVMQSTWESLALERLKSRSFI